MQSKKIQPYLRYWDKKANLLFSGMEIPLLGPLITKLIIWQKKKKLFKRICDGPPASKISD
jgi:hypothetical protein